ncbi:hypothetical protein [Celerinatantimonas sp. YJH-8]|uniref:hypothetical protein n=1 Tax=Celerinatantimonas sp. YJH-8 TaxID=3228714 RepID=UPI0038C3CFF0
MKDLNFQQAVKDCCHKNIKGMMDFVIASSPLLLATLQNCFDEDENQSLYAERVVADSYYLFALNAIRFRKCNPDLARLAFFEILARRLSFSRQPLNMTGNEPMTDSIPETAIESLQQIFPIPDGIVPPRIKSIQLLQIAARSHSRVVLDSPWLAHVERQLQYYLGLNPLGLAANGEAIYPDTFDPQQAFAVRCHRWKTRVILAIRKKVVTPLLEGIARTVIRFEPGRQWMYRYGLSRRLMQKDFPEQLRITVDPQRIQKMGAFKRKMRQKMDSRLIWDGDWDQCTGRFEDNSRYRFISDIWQHRDTPQDSRFYQHQLEQIDAGEPFVDRYNGVSLTSPRRIVGHIQLYLLYMYNMACFGFSGGQGKDEVWIALDRHNDVVKVNHGLHRTAMAQVIGLRQMEVSVRAVHRLWWQQMLLDCSATDDIYLFFSHLQQCNGPLLQPCSKCV